MMSRYLEQQFVIFVIFYYKDVKKNIKDIVIFLEIEKLEVEELVNIFGLLKKMVIIFCSEYFLIVFFVYFMSEMLFCEMVRKFFILQMVMQVSIFCIREKYVLLCIMYVNMYVIMYVNMVMLIKNNFNDLYIIIFYLYLCNSFSVGM